MKCENIKYFKALCLKQKKKLINLNSIDNLNGEGFNSVIECLIKTLKE